MWMFTVYGFFSAVCAAKGKRIDPDQMMIRARAKRHLLALQKRFPDMLKQYKIAESAGTDYLYRIVVPKRTWLLVANELAEEINYSNFKAAVGHTDEVYHTALMQVWSTMHRLQPAQPVDATRQPK